MKISTEKIVTAYNLLNTAKINKMDDMSKFTLIKAIRKMKPIATSFAEFREDAQFRLQDERFGEMQAKAQEWQKAEKEHTEIPLSMQERIEVNAYFDQYASKVNQCLKEEAEKVNELDYAPLGEEAFTNLISSNDGWNVEQILAVSEVLTE